MSSPFDCVPNIGPRLGEALISVGILNAEHLRKIGAMSAWERLREAGHFDCINSLLALEGAVQNVRWHSLPHEDKQRLAAHLRARTGVPT